MFSLKTILKRATRKYLLQPLDRLFRTLEREELAGLALRAWYRLGARVRLLLIVFLIILPAALALLFIRTYAVNVSHGDELAAVVPLYDKLHSGHLSFADLFAQLPLGEHRIFFPRLVLLSLGLITHENNVVACYFSWFLLCLIGGVLFLVHRRIFRTGEIALAAFIPVSWLIFDLNQSQNFVQGFQIQIFMVVLFFLLAVYLLATSRGRWWCFALAVASGVVSTFSMNNGLLAWPIGLLLILWLRQSQSGELRRRYLRMGLIWCLVGFVVVLSYYVNYQLPLGHSPFEYVIQHPLSSVAFFLASLGSLAHYLLAAVLMGLLLLLLYVYAGGTIVFQGKPRCSSAVSLCLILFVLLSLAGWTLNRSFKGLDAAMASRATTIGSLGIVGLYVGMMSLKTRYVNVKSLLLGFLLSLTLLGGGLSYYCGIQSGPVWREDYHLYGYVLSTYSVQSDENLLLLYPWDHFPQVAREGAEVLEKYRLSVFSRPSLDPDQLTPVEGSTQFHIDSVENRAAQLQDGRPTSSTSSQNEQDQWIVTTSQSEETLTILGWAIDQHAQDTAGGIFVSIDGKMDIPALYGLDRPDVAARFGDSRYRFSGFLASFSTSVLGEGQHVLSLKIVTRDKTGYYEPEQKIILEVT